MLEFRHRWAVMGLWMFSSVAGIMMVIAVGILLPSISADLGLNPSQQGFYGSAAFLGNLFLTLPVSWWVSRYRPKILTTATLALGSGLLFVQGLAPNFALLVFGRLSFGVATLAREPARVLLMHRLFAPREFMIVTSAYNALFGIVVGGGLAFTPLLLGGAGDDWRRTLYGFGAALAVLCLAWMVFGSNGDGAAEVESGEPEERDDGDGDGGRFALLGRVLGYKDLWIAGFGSMGATMGWAAFVNFYPTLALNTYGVSLNWSGAILGTGIAVGGFSGIALSRLVAVVGADRRKNILQAIGVVMALSYLGMALVDSIPALLAIAVLGGLAQGYWPILNSVPFYLPGIRPRESAVAVSFMMTLGTFGVAVGPALTGALQEWLGDLRLALVLVGVSPLTLAVAGSLVDIRTDRED